MIEFDPYDYATHNDPYPTYARLRGQAPLYRNTDRDFWALSRHADVATALRDTARFSSANGVSLEPAATGPKARRHASFLAMDAPEHTRLRALVSRAFSPRLVRDLEPRIRAIALGHLQAALEHGSVDLISDLAAKLPMDVISELLGVPAADRDTVRHLADQLIHRDEGIYDITPAGALAARELHRYYRDLIAEKRRHRAEDFTSTLLHDQEEPLGDDEIVSVLFLLGVAGNETTTRLLGNAWYWAWRHPDQRTAAYAGAIDAWVEETLRYAPPTQQVTRTTTQDVQLHGLTVPAGDRVLLLIGAANRDPIVFADPDRYDLTRDTGKAISFGLGPHFCLGAPLARLEARVVLEEFIAHVTDYDIDAAHIGRLHSVSVAGFTALPSTLKPR